MWLNRWGRTTKKMPKRGDIITFEAPSLTRVDKDGKIVEAMATSWKTSEDKKTWTFTINDKAYWSNGDKVTAQDYEYAWKRVLNPETGAEYAYQMYYIEGAEAYNTGKGSVDDVAVKALDDYTLEVKLHSPTSYFLELTAFPCYFPVNKKIVKKIKDGQLKLILMYLMVHLSL